MFRSTLPLNFAQLPALLVVMATSWAAADEPFPFPAPPVRSKAVYLAPDSLSALPAPAARKTASRPPGSSTVQKTQAEVVPAPRGGLVAPVRKSVVPNAAETDRRVERLKKQLEELNELLSRPPVEPPVIERPIVIPPPASQPDAETPFIDDESPPRATTPPVVPVAPMPEPPHDPSHDSPRDLPHEESEPPGSSKSKAPVSGLIKGLPVAAVDRVHVADNLFAAGEYVLAEEIYSQVDRKAISSDESGWVEFQLANCSRRAGRLDDAKKRYRRVVADPALGWLQNMAKWRLDAIDEREQLIREHSRLEAAIKQHTEVPGAAPKS
jgi:hypothetical protein